MRTIDHPARSRRSLFRWVRERFRLGLRIAGMVLHYFTEGRRIRKAYKHCEASGDTFWVDESMPGER